MLDKDYPVDSRQSPLTPRVTIGLPVYNGEPYIHHALRSLLAQSLTHFELLVSDNASTDGTREICEEFARSDTRVRYVRQAANRGPGANFGYVLEQARGAYFMWAAHDDLWEPHFLSELVGVLDARPDVALAFCRFDNVDDHGRRYVAFKPVDWKAVFQRSKSYQFAAMALLDDAATQKANHVYGLIRMNALRKCGGINELAYPRSGEDIHLLLKLLSQGEFVIVDDILFHYRIKSRPIRSSEPIGSYVLQRIAGRTPGHVGNLSLFLLSNHAHHSSLRKVVMDYAPISLLHRVLIWIGLMLREPWVVMKTIPVGALRELRLLKPSQP